MDTRTPESPLTQVRFVGGPLHGRSAFMAHPEFHMDLTSPDGEPIVYARRVIASSVIDGHETTVATYAPVGMPDHEFERLANDA